MESFVKNPVDSVWKTIYSNYDTALSTKASKMKADKKKDLILFDKWFQSELPDSIHGRSPKYITREELCKLMKWKLTRGKFRPRLTELVQVNSEDEVKDASTKAFKALPDVAAAIQALTVLKAVGPATASAVLTAGAPQRAAFMADESMQALPGLQPIKYDLPFYRNYMSQVSGLVKQLNKLDGEKFWTPHKVELTLWTYQIIKTMNTDLYETLSAKHKAPTTDDSSGPPRKKLKT